MEVKNLFAAVSVSLFALVQPSSWAQETTVSTPTIATQRSLTAIRGNYDQDIPTPQLVIVSDKDQVARALKEIATFQSMIGVRSWTDLVGTGTIQYGYKQDEPEQARLEIRQPGAYRLDTGGDGSEQRTMRIMRSRGSWRRGTQPLNSLDTRDAAVGLFAFPRLEEQGFPSTNDLLIDQGMVRIEDTVYHRITLESPPAAGEANDYASWGTVDLYFNADTHLLEKSATCVHGGGPSTMLRVTTYGQYQNVDGVLIPMKYRETLNGQLTWVLQLREVHLNTGLSADEFHF